MEVVANFIQDHWLTWAIWCAMSGAIFTSVFEIKCRIDTNRIKREILADISSGKISPENNSALNSVLLSARPQHPGGDKQPLLDALSMSDMMAFIASEAILRGAPSPFSVDGLIQDFLVGGVIIGSILYGIYNLF